MKRLASVLVVVLMATTTLNATKRALVIGIGAYPTESGWRQINGDKDIPLVEEVLVANGFSKTNIVELNNEQATAAAIRREMNALIGKAQAGDVIYIHFSGHGQQVTDIHGDEEDGLDEAWIPYDAQFAYAKGKYEGENHIIDDQINVWLHQLRTRVGQNGKITVVADACHSGGGSRGEDEEENVVVRGTADTFVLPGQAKPFTGETGAEIDWVFISACKSYQSNYEYKGNGSLSYALSLQKDKLSSVSCGDVQRSIRSTISNIVPFTQTPVVETTASGKVQSIF